jgi:hypothetical protein
MMIAPLLLARLASGPELGPMLPPGINPNFQTAVTSVEQKLNVSDFAGAEKAADLLPKSTIVVQWDDSKVPAHLRSEFASERDKALQAWRGITGTTITVSKDHPDIKFDFVEVLPNPPGSGIPAGATYFWSTATTDPRLETVIGLKRMTPPEDINPVNVHNEVAAALGSYFGLVVQPFPGSYMGRSEMNYQTISQPNPQEMLVSRDLLKISHDLREAVKKRKRLSPTNPKVFFDPKGIDMGNVVQGDPANFLVQITNSGNAPLAMRFQPDCSCVSTGDNYQVIQPSGSYLLKGRFNTSLTVGEIHHTLLVNTNDPDQANFMVPVTIKVKPRYRFIFPQGTVYKLPEAGITFPVYLVLSDNSGIRPKDAQLAGIPGDVTFEPWKGTLADPGLGEGPKERQGYKLTVHLTGALSAPGRDPITLWMTTDNAQFPTLQANMYAQRGVVVMPPELYMGEVEAGVRKYSIMVSGPAKSFKIKKVTTDWAHLKFEWYPNQDETEYHISATYDGNGQMGPIVGSVTIETDDKDQPFISIPIQGTIK